MNTQRCIAARFTSLPFGLVLFIMVSGPWTVLAVEEGGMRDPNAAKPPVAPLKGKSLKQLDESIPIKEARDEGNVLVLEDFSSMRAGEFPTGWMARQERSIPYFVIVETEDGSKYLSADVFKIDGVIFLRITWDMNEYPIFEWTWRTRVLPERGNEKRQRTNDSAAGIYIVFPLRFPFIPDTLKYVWSTTLPTGTEFSNGLGRNKILVVKSGDASLGQWIVERRNIYQDYQRRFGRTKPPQPIAVGIITDGDDTKSRSAADYGYFKAMRSGL